MSDNPEQITPAMIISAYQRGYFPMARSRRSKIIEWILPSVRGIIPIDDFHIPSRLKRDIKKSDFTITYNTAFEEVITACAKTDYDLTNPKRDATWINKGIISLYCELHALGIAHSVEVWDGNKLIGGLYGLALGRAFFGESMFSKQTNASKIALVNLVARLKERGFTLLDAQFPNDHLKQFGAFDIPQRDYERLLKEALKHSANFD